MTRLAPSPTGALHLGNARTFLVTWALARRLGWGVLLRIEDLDTPRVKPETIGGTRDVLAWLGIDWDDEAPLQSTDLGPCREAMARLAGRGLAYPCSLTRSEIEAASAPNEGDHETRFGPELRPASFRPGQARAFDDPTANWRLAVGAGPVAAAAAFEDAVAGPQRHDVAGVAGDFLLWTKRGVPSYQLAVSVDDARQGVSVVVRGDDLLPSAARQRLIWDALAPEPPFDRPFPRQVHLPLVRGEDGRRLAKRHGDTRLETYRQRGVPAERVVGLMGAWCGLTDRPAPMSAADFAAGFDLNRMPRTDVTFTGADDAWLTEC